MGWVFLKWREFWKTACSPKPSITTCQYFYTDISVISVLFFNSALFWTIVIFWPLLVSICQIPPLPAHCCYQGAFQEVNILMNRAHLTNCKIQIDRLPVGKKSLKIHERRKNYSDKTVWTGMPKGIIYKKNIFFNKFFWWPKLAIFSQNGHFLPLNGRKDRQDFAQSCPRGWSNQIYFNFHLPY